jgi:hypothetical protein
MFQIDMKKEIKRSIVIALIASLFGIGIGIYIELKVLEHGYFYICSGMAAFFTSALLWWGIIERKKRFNVYSGILVGSLSGSLSHIICWYLFFISINIQHLFFKNWYSSSGEPPMNLVQAILGSFAYSFWSLVFVGWITIPAGAIICSIVCVIIKKNITRPSS